LKEMQRLAKFAARSQWSVLVKNRVEQRSHLHTAQVLCGVHFDQIVPARQPFKTRHIGPSENERQQMLKVLGYQVSCLLFTLFHCLPALFQ
jgi:hypothetical protein